MSIWTPGGIQYLVISGPAQSNGPMEGRGTGAATACTAPRAYVHRYDGNLVPAADPAGGNTNNRYTPAHAGLNSYTPALLNALWNGGAGAYGANDAIIMCGSAQGGTATSAWATSAGAAPPVANTQFGIWELRLRDLVRNLPNPKILCLIGDIGETDAASPATAPNWEPGMTTCYNAMITMLTSAAPAGLGLTFAKALRMLLRILPDLPATGFTGWSPPHAPCVQDAQNTWITTQNGLLANSIVGYKPPGGLGMDAGLLHFETAALATIGTAVGGLVVAAP